MRWTFVLVSIGAGLAAVVATLASPPSGVTPFGVEAAALRRASDRGEEGWSARTASSGGSPVA
jgi:hypothetical protein